MASSSFAEIENQNRSLSLPEVRPGTQTAKEKRAGCILPYIDSFKSPVPAGSLPAADCLPQELLLSLKRQRGADPALKGKSLALASRAPSPTAVRFSLVPVVSHMKLCIYVHAAQHTSPSQRLALPQEMEKTEASDGPHSLRLRGWERHILPVRLRDCTR